MASSHLRCVCVLPCGKGESFDNPTFHGIHRGWGLCGVYGGAGEVCLPNPRRPDGRAGAPLLCAGIIGFRFTAPFRHRAGGKLGLYGFGAAARLAIQVARHWNVAVYAMTRDARHRGWRSRWARCGGGTVDDRRTNSTPPLSLLLPGKSCPRPLRP